MFSSLKFILSSYTASLTYDILEDIIITHANRENKVKFATSTLFSALVLSPRFYFVSKRIRDLLNVFVTLEAFRIV